jgi:hypothetical protein
VEEVLVPATLQRVVLMENLVKLGLHHTAECEILGKSFEFILSQCCIVLRA